MRRVVGESDSLARLSLSFCATTSYTPNPHRRHTRGRRGRVPVEGLPTEEQLEWEEAHVDVHQSRVSGIEKGRAKRLLSEAKRFSERGVRFKPMATRVVNPTSFEPKHKAQLDKLHYARRRRIALGIEVHSKKERRYREYAGFKSKMRPVMPWKRPSHRPTIPLIPRGPEPLTLAQVRSAVAKWKRDGTLPSFHCSEVVNFRLDSMGKDFLRFKRALLIREGVEMNPGPCPRAGTPTLFKVSGRVKQYTLYRCPVCRGEVKSTVRRVKCYFNHPVPDIPAVPPLLEVLPGPTLVLPPVEVPKGKVPVDVADYKVTSTGVKQESGVKPESKGKEEAPEDSGESQENGDGPLPIVEEEDTETPSPPVSEPAYNMAEVPPPPKVQPSPSTSKPTPDPSPPTPPSKPVTPLNVTPPKVNTLDGHRLKDEEVWVVVRDIVGRELCEEEGRVSVETENRLVEYDGERRVISDRGIREEKAPFVMTRVKIQVNGNVATKLPWKIIGLTLVLSCLMFVLNKYSGLLAFIVGLVCCYRKSSEVMLPQKYRVYYAPHLVTSLVLEYDCHRTNLEVFRENAWARLRRFGAFPLPDRDALLLLTGTVKAAEALLKEKGFFCHRAASFKAARVVQ